MLDDLTFSLLELRHKGYQCSQILSLLALRAQGKENPGLVRAMAGLARGTDQPEGVCGTLTGASCLLAMAASKGADGEQELMELPLLQEELWNWFRTTYGATYGGVTCFQILADGTPPSERCGAIVLETYLKCRELLQAQGLDPQEDAHG